MATWDRFDIVEAYYIFALHYHCGGDTSDNIMARINKLQFRPGVSLGSLDSGLCHFGLSENGYEIYSDLVQNHPDASVR